MKHRKFIHIDKSDDSQVNGTSDNDLGRGVSNATASTGGSTFYLPIVPLNVNN